MGSCNSNNITTEKNLDNMYEVKTLSPNEAITQMDEMIQFISSFRKVKSAESVFSSNAKTETCSIESLLFTLEDMKKCINNDISYDKFCVYTNDKKTGIKTIEFKEKNPKDLWTDDNICFRYSKINAGYSRGSTNDIHYATFDCFDVYFE